MRTLFSSLFFLCLLVAPVHAQYITFDRPGLSLSAAPLGRQAISIEAGIPLVSYSSLEGADVSIYSYSIPVNVRFGMTDAIELRAATSVYNGVSFSGDDADGLDGDGDFGFDFLALGAKFGLPSTSLPFNLSVTPEVWVPLDDEFDTFIGATVAAGSQLESGFTLLGNVGLLGPTDSFGDSFLTRLSFQGGYPLTPQVYGFVETEYTVVQDVDDLALLGLGAAFSVTPTLMLDASLYAGLTDNTDDVRFSLGGSLRF